ncbi:hypothetical protein BN126310444 [Stenotrophomonas thermophila]|nr:hypothetical protein BN126310444 [Stenotrophomonas maltophilia]
MDATGGVESTVSRLLLRQNPALRAIVD